MNEASKICFYWERRGRVEYGRSSQIECKVEWIETWKDLKFLWVLYCPWRVFEAGEGFLHGENGIPHANCDFAFIAWKTWASQRIRWLMQTISSQFERLWDEFRKWFGWIKCTHAGIFHPGLESFFGSIARLRRSFSLGVRCFSQQFHFHGI